MGVVRLLSLKSSKWNTNELISNSVLFQSHLEYTLGLALYITFTVFYYNNISFRCTAFPVPVKGLYYSESYSLHVMHLVCI